MKNQRHARITIASTLVNKFGFFCKSRFREHEQALEWVQAMESNNITIVRSRWKRPPTML